MRGSCHPMQAVGRLDVCGLGDPPLVADPGGVPESNPHLGTLRGPSSAPIGADAHSAFLLVAVSLDNSERRDRVDHARDVFGNHREKVSEFQHAVAQFFDVESRQ